jgi:eukaryotic-like serine/threonine-protein kinase
MPTVERSASAGVSRYNRRWVSTISTGVAEPAAIGANDQDLAPGSEVGEYRIEHVLGKGGFGTVYGALQPVIGKQVAIKVLARKYSADPTVVSRFVAEARAVNQIRHRHIIDIFSFGQLPDGRHYYVMEYLDGAPLDAYLRERGRLPLDEAVPILRQIARALDAAHAKGIAHRDLKPENIFLVRDPDGSLFAKLLDFGIAKLLTPEDDVRHKTNTGVPIGTPYYMSPEQCRGKDVDHRTDVYSFGIVTYRLLTGAYPFEGEDYMDLLFKQTNEEPPPPSAKNPLLSPAVDAAIAWMMRKDRAQRPPTVSEAVTALDPASAMTPPMTVARGSKPTVPPHDAKTISADALAATITPDLQRPLPARRPVAIWIAAAVVVVAAAATALFVATRETERPSRATDVAPAAPAPALPTSAPAPAAQPPVEAVDPPPAAPVATEPARVETPTTRRTKPIPTRRPPAVNATSKPAAGSATPTEPPDDRPRPGDLPSLGSDVFKP